MKTEAATGRKPYAPPTVTRHGDIVSKTLGNMYTVGEMWNPGGPPHEH